MNPSAIRKHIVRVTFAIVSMGIVGLLWQKYTSTKDLQNLIALCEAIPTGASIATIRGMTEDVAGALVDAGVNGIVTITLDESDCRLELVLGEFNGRKVIANR